MVVMGAAQQLVTQIGVVAGTQVTVTVQASGRGGVGSLHSFPLAYLVGMVAALAAAGCGLFMRDTPPVGAAGGGGGGLTPWPPVP
jgi:hypothetical protein